MKLIQITSDMLAEANRKALEMGALNNSITNGKGNIYGFVGELIAEQVLGGYIVNSYDFDLVLYDGRTTVDVKTKKVSSPPKEYYDCSVANYNTKQKCDYYCFVRVLDDLSVGWFLGVYKKDQYFKDAVFLKKGDIDPSNNFTVKADCFNLKINNLKILC